MHNICARHRDPPPLVNQIFYQHVQRLYPKPVEKIPVLQGDGKARSDDYREKLCELFAHMKSQGGSLIRDAAHRTRPQTQQHLGGSPQTPPKRVAAPTEAVDVTPTKKSKARRCVPSAANASPAETPQKRPAAPTDTQPAADQLPATKRGKLRRPTISEAPGNSGGDSIRSLSRRQSGPVEPAVPPPTPRVTSIADADTGRSRRGRRVDYATLTRLS